MKAPIRYVFLLLFIVLFVYLFTSISTRLNELFNFEIKQSSLDEQLKLESIKNQRKIRLKKFKNYLNDNYQLDQLDVNNQNLNRPIWKQISYKSFGNHQGHNHHSSFEFAKNCRLSNCFNFSKCKPGDVLKIHIYPDPNELINSSQIFISSTYKKILHIIRQSKYYEPDPKKACIYVTSFDTLDRDPLSIDYQKNLPRFIPVDNGQNHIIFNLFSGTWPAYNEMDFSNFNLGLAMLIKASIRYQDYRPDFDISLPLFSKAHPLRGDTLPIFSNQLNTIGNNYQTKSYSIRYMNETRLNKFDNKNLLVFKGKRYIYGIGSETRNMLHHLDNKEDILIFSTCKHGKKWKELKDDRCLIDNQEYDKYDYNNLMSNSTFCLVPRGRRLGSYRFLEALGSGCIPVILSNDFIKPFSSVIDWNSIVIDGDERLLLNLPEILRSISWRKIAKMRSACLKIYDKYFSSIEKIILTTIKILETRIQAHLSLNSFIWMNSYALWFHQEYSNRLNDYPFTRSNQLIVAQKKEGFTAICYINKPISPSIIFRLLKNLSKSEYLAKILILWALPSPVQVPKSITENIQLFSSKLDIEIIIPDIKNANAKLYPYKSIKTNCILNIEPDSTLTYEELDFAFKTWLSFKHRIVGFIARDHYYDEAKSIWYYTSKWTNSYSIILLDNAFFHKYYSWLYTNYLFNHNLTSNLFKLNSNLDDKLNLINNLVNLDDQNQSENTNENTISSSICLDLIFNFLVSHVTREPPIKVSQRKRTTNQSFLGLAMSGGTFSDSQKCFQNLLNYTFNYLPLIKSQLRLDPLLFKDSVSTFRKKYQKMEQFT